MQLEQPWYILLKRGKFRAQTAHRGSLDASHHQNNWIVILLYIRRNFKETSWHFVVLERMY